MIFSNIVYVDPSITTGGDGTTPSTALKDLPSIDALVDDTMYLIRRTENSSYCNIRGSSENNTIKRIGLIGMPLSNTARYLALPEVVKSAWGSDSSQKAQIRVDAQNSYQFTTCYEFELYNVNFERSALDAGGYTGAINFTSAQNVSSEIGGPSDKDYYGSLNIENCRFAGVNEPIDSLDYVTQPSSSKATNYVNHSGHLSNATIINNVICYDYTDTSYMGMSFNAISLGTVHSRISIIGNMCYGTTSGNQSPDMMMGSGGGFIYGSGEANPRRLECHNNSFKIRKIGYTYPLAICFTRMFGFVNLSNLTYTEGNDFAEPTALNTASSLVSLVGGAAHMEGIVVTLPKLWNLCSSPAIKLRCDSNQQYKNEQIVKNLTVTFADAGAGLGDKVNDTYLNQWSQDYSAVYLDNFNIAENINIINTEGRAAFLAHIRNLTGTNIIKGSICASYIYGTIDSITSSRNQMVLLYSYSCLNVGTITCGEGEADNPVVWSPNYGDFNSSKIYIGTCNKQIAAIGPVWADNGYNREEQVGGFVCINNNGHIGRVSVYHKYCTCDTWSATRTGSSSNAVLKFQNSANNSRNAISIGMTPGVVRLSEGVTNGHYLVTAYIAYKDLTRIDDKFWIELFTAKESFDSRTSGVWMDDSSSWNNIESDVIMKKWICDISLDDSGPLDARIFFRGYGATSVLYLDPIFIVEQLGS